jgi:hypothetical protein
MKVTIPLVLTHDPRDYYSKVDDASLATAIINAGKCALDIAHTIVQFFIMGQSSFFVENVKVEWLLLRNGGKNRISKGIFTINFSEIAQEKGRHQIFLHWSFRDNYFQASFSNGLMSHQIKANDLTSKELTRAVITPILELLEKDYKNQQNSLEVTVSHLSQLKSHL